jgi:arylsulfatase A-like enzyme
VDFAACARVGRLLFLLSATLVSCGHQTDAGLAPGRYFFALDPPRGNEVLAELQPESGSPPGLSAEVWVRLDESTGGAPDCGLRWDEADAPPKRECRVSVREGDSPAWLEVKVAGPENGKLKITSPGLTTRSPARSPQVFVLVLDTLRADSFESVLALRPESARLREFMSDAIHFENARAPSSWTRPSTASLLTGLSPRRHRVESDFSVLPSALETLPEILRGHGYRTFAWSTNPSVLPLWGYAQGFDSFVDVDSFQWDESKPEAAGVFERVMAQLEAAEGHGEFFYIHLIDPHNPYVPDVSLAREIRDDPRFRHIYPGPMERKVSFSDFTHYTAEVAELHEQLGAFLDELQRAGAYRDALILLVSDHGEEFGDHGRRFHGLTLYEEMLRIPLLLKLPGNHRGGQRIETEVTLEDVLPTVLEALSLPAPRDLDGRDVLAPAPLPARPHVASLRLKGKRLRSLKSGSWKLIADGSGGTKLYDLASDPSEKTDVANTHPERVEQMQRELELRSLQGEAGWHLLGCGVGGPGSIAFSVRNWKGRFRERNFESTDSTRGDAPNLKVAMQLDYDAFRPQRDDDEVVLLAPAKEMWGGASVIASHEPLRLMRGMQTRVEERSEIALDPEDTSMHVDSADRPDCFDVKWMSGSGSHPTLRVWYVPPPATLPPDELAPGVADRLRALGYLDAQEEP